VTSVFKISFKKFIASKCTSNSSNSHNTSYSQEQLFPAVDYTEATVEWKQWAVEDCDTDTGEDSEAAGDSYRL